MYRVIIDTSVFIAGLLTKSPTSSSAQIIQMWRSGAFTLVTAPQLMTELVAKLIDKKIPDDVIVDLIKVIAKASLHIPGACETTKLDFVDPNDNMFLAAAYESGADYLVSMDKKSLLPLKHFHGTQIRTPELFLRVLMGLTDEEAEEEALQEDVDSEIKALEKETWARRHEQPGKFES